MKLLIWIAVIGVAYAAGYFSDFSKADEKADPIQNSGSVAEVNLPTPTRPVARVKPVAETSPSSEGKSQLTLENRPANNKSEPLSAQPRVAIPEAPHATPEPVAPQETKLSDEEIDNLLPAPFNEELKRTHGPMREKYKEFAEAKEPNEWDAITENRMTDLLLGSAYSKFIELDSVKCRVNYCEIRGRELKKNIFSLLMSEMSVQDWWDMGLSQWGTGDGGVFYGLIMKNVPQN